MQVIALACHLAGKGSGPSGPSGQAGTSKAVPSSAEAVRPFLVAVPASVLPNWEAELKRWAPALKVGG